MCCFSFPYALVKTTGTNNSVSQCWQQKSHRCWYQEIYLVHFDLFFVLLFSSHQTITAGLHNWVFLRSALKIHSPSLKRPKGLVILKIFTMSSDVLSSLFRTQVMRCSAISISDTAVTIRLLPVYTHLYACASFAYVYSRYVDWWDIVGSQRWSIVWCSITWKFHVFWTKAIFGLYFLPTLLSQNCPGQLLRLCQAESQGSWKKWFSSLSFGEVCLL